MRRETLVLIGAAIGLAATAGMILRSGAPGPVGAAHVASAPAGESAYVLGYTMEDINGEPQDLAQYRGKVILIVNTASKCGHTPQYAGLQTIYERYKDRGLVILGFPANNFRNQEPGSDEEIAEFCSQNYGVTFPMFSKISVGGDDQCDLYKQLTTMPEPIGGPVTWNFQKYLVDRQGNVVAMFDPPVKPDDTRLTNEIERLLGNTPES
jgi:glutathione peroxidase